MKKMKLSDIIMKESFIASIPKEKRMEECRNYWSQYHNQDRYIVVDHTNSNCSKEYVWRVPKSWNWFTENVKVGDQILCSTKFGCAPVIVTRIEILDKCPVDFVVKKVCKNSIRRAKVC